MTLEKYLRRLLALSELGEKCSDADWQEAMSGYMTYLYQCTSVAEVKVIAEDWGRLFSLPVDTHILTCKRLVELERTPEHLRILAHTLYGDGPDWDDESAELLRQADEREKE